MPGSAPSKPSSATIRAAGRSWPHVRRRTRSHVIRRFPRRPGLSILRRSHGRTAGPTTRSSRCRGTASPGAVGGKTLGDSWAQCSRSVVLTFRVAPVSRSRASLRTYRSSTKPSARRPDEGWQKRKAPLTFSCLFALSCTYPDSRGVLGFRPLGRATCVELRCSCRDGRGVPRSATARGRGGSPIVGRRAAFPRSLVSLASAELIYGRGAATNVAARPG